VGRVINTISANDDLLLHFAENDGRNVEFHTRDTAPTRVDSELTRKVP